MKERFLSQPTTTTLLFVLIAAGTLPLSYQIAHPYVTSADNNTAYFAQTARNFARHGLLATKLGLATNMGERLPWFS